MRPSWRALAVGVVVLSVAVAVALLLDRATSEASRPPRVVDEADALAALDAAVKAALAHDEAALCGVGVQSNCEVSLQFATRDQLPWPTAAPEVVFSGRFEGGPLPAGGSTSGGYLLTVCTPGPDGGVTTDFVVYDGPAGRSAVRDPVFWAGTTIEPSTELGAPTTC
jgi:hypothetical protein